MRKISKAEEQLSSFNFHTSSDESNECVSCGNDAPGEVEDHSCKDRGACRQRFEKIYGPTDPHENSHHASKDMVNATDLAHELGLSLKELSEAANKTGITVQPHMDAQVSPEVAGKIRTYVDDNWGRRDPNPDTEGPMEIRQSSFDSRYASEKKKKDHYQFIKKQGDKWVIIQKGTGKVLSHHDTREKAIAAFHAMMAHKHGNVAIDPTDWRNEYFNLDSDW